MHTFLIANHDNHHYISDVAAGLWMISCMGFRGKGLEILLDRSFPPRGDGWMSQTRVGWGGEGFSKPRILPEMFLTGWLSLK